MNQAGEDGTSVAGTLLAGVGKLGRRACFYTGNRPFYDSNGWLHSSFHIKHTQFLKLQRVSILHKYQIYSLNICFVVLINWKLKWHVLLLLKELTGQAAPVKIKGQLIFQSKTQNVNYSFASTDAAWPNEILQQIIFCWRLQHLLFHVVFLYFCWTTLRCLSTGCHCSKSIYLHLSDNWI